ncbi:Protein transport protein SSS1 [Cyberlindnera fabianii]|uniref:Protein transport protein SSS1 n=1 Tax=Cyberlindnera fabianii TaxID=36022 RepID=A0A1V2L513_CYBFA|nr:Protein transport protein SSS1 [Cyberlindnera fabianii]
MASEGLEKITEVPVEFFKDGAAFVKKCTKPDQKEYLKIIRAVGVGFIMMGVVGYAIKLIHIPIRYLIV